MIDASPKGLWELINPSDSYTFEADDEIIAALCAALLSPGFCAKEIAGLNRRTPLFFLAADAKTAFEQHYAVELDEVLRRCAEIAECFESFLIGNAEDRACYSHAMAAIDDEAKRTAFAEAWADERRSSINDIGAAAKRYAAKFRQLEKTAPAKR